jgi:hypothetical protein
MDLNAFSLFSKKESKPTSKKEREDSNNKEDKDIKQEERVTYS